MKKFGLFLTLTLIIYACPSLFSLEPKTVCIMSCSEKSQATLQFIDTDSDGLYDHAIETTCDGIKTNLIINYPKSKSEQSLNENTPAIIGVIQCFPATVHNASWDKEAGQPKIEKVADLKITSNIRYTISFDNGKRFLAERYCCSDTLFIFYEEWNKPLNFDTEKMWISYTRNSFGDLNFHILSAKECDAKVLITDLNNNTIAEQSIKLIDDRIIPFKNFVTFKNLHLPKGVYIIKVQSDLVYKSEKFIID